MIVREPPPSRMRKLRAKINVRPRTRDASSPLSKADTQPLEPIAEETLAEEALAEEALAEEALAEEALAEEALAEEALAEEALAEEALAEEALAEEALAEALRGTFPASDPPSSWAG